MNSSDVFKHLNEEEVKDYMDRFITEGMSEDDAFTETYSIDCNMDNEEED